MKALIKKEKVTLVTYPYSDASPVPEFGRMYPYNRIDGYAHEGMEVEWEMVVLENDFIKLWVNPAVGGKIWGAIEKSTGKEFIYFNHVAKFRDVAMRGPWTSGGIEFNIGILGHALSCSSPVDYHISENADGSVSCHIGAMDWPSRTRWFVEISLRPDTAWFKTRTGWHNTSGIEQAYYNWSNAGIKTAGKLEYVFPGNAYLGHDGRAHSWPVDAQGRDLSKYENNAFGHYKSYHVIGASSDFWGCYWHEDQFGMAHYARYDEKPGRKIWIWGLSRYGMIWEDLLTDNDGQYTEVQSGRLFNQSICASSATPFKHRSFMPGSFDSWEEYWMPVKGIAGLSYACPELTIRIGDEGIELCANMSLSGLLRITDGAGTRLLADAGGGEVGGHDTVRSNEQLLTVRLSAMEVIFVEGEFDKQTLRIFFEGRLLYDAAEERHSLERPKEIARDYQYDSVEGLYLQGKEWERQRFFAWAGEKYIACLEKDPYHVRALAGMAALRLRTMDYEEALALLRTALSVDSYDGEVNYLYGLASLRLGKLYEAKDGFAIASQLPGYRTAALTELGSICLLQGQPLRALEYLDEAGAGGFCQAVRLRVAALRKMGKNVEAREAALTGLKHDPLDHVLRYEAFPADSFISGIHSEWVHETMLELASFYAGIEAWEDVLNVLALSPAHALVELWKAYAAAKQGRGIASGVAPGIEPWIKTGSAPRIQPGAEPRIEPGKDPRIEPVAEPRIAPDGERMFQTVVNVEAVFPHRHEDIVVLRWALMTTVQWEVKYFLALGLIQLMKEDEALELLRSCGNEPAYYPFYLVRARLEATEADLLRAVALAPEAWRTWLQLCRYYIAREAWQQALEAAEKGYALHPGNYYLGLLLARCCMYTAKYKEGLEVMSHLKVLPNEGASEGRNVWRETNLYAAIAALKDNHYDEAGSHIRAARIWPEHIGVGKPYDVDQRLEDYLDYLCAVAQGRDGAAFQTQILSFRDRYPEWPAGSADLLALLFAEGASQMRWLQQWPDNVPSRWGRAFLLSDTAALAEMSNEKYIPPVPLPYEILYEDREFPLIKALYHTGLLTSKTQSI